jgi:hypothetical protein
MIGSQSDHVAEAAKARTSTGQFQLTVEACILNRGASLEKSRLVHRSVQVS